MILVTVSCAVKPRFGKKGSSWKEVIRREAEVERVPDDRDAIALGSIVGGHVSGDQKEGSIEVVGPNPERHDQSMLTKISWRIT